jgi:lipopolysaccharide export LptBFGC system permease protein LptF
MPTLEELTKMVEEAGGDPQKLSEATKAALAELSGAQSALHQSNREAAERRKKLEAFEAAEQQRKEAEMTEAQKTAEQIKATEERAQKAEQERDAVQARMLETLKRTSVISAASAAGFNDPADAWLYIDRDKITVNEAGAVEGVDQAIKTLAEKKPYLLKAAPDKRPGSPPGPNSRQSVKKPGEKTTPEAPVIRF